MRQALSYFDAAVNVPDRSACLLYYYSLLNFAKAELLCTRATQIVGQRIAHGLSFNPIKARKVTSDALVVHDGVFRLLYEQRVGRTIASGQRLGIQRLLANIPEITSQLTDVNMGSTALTNLFHMIAADQTSSWPTLLTFSDIDRGTTTGKLFYRTFRQIQVDNLTWRDHFGLSRRAVGPARLYESLDTVKIPSPGTVDTGAAAITWRMKDILSYPLHGGADGWIVPSIYKSRLLPMPVSLARYATIYYASSLVRYRPSMFDSQTFPQHAYLFDAIARECALPILVDALTALEGQAQIFYREDALRL